MVVQVGFNNALPDPETGNGCTTWSWHRAGVPGRGVKTYAGLYDEVFAGVKVLRRPIHGVRRDDDDRREHRSAGGGVAGWSPGSVADSGEKKEAKEWAVAAYDRWNTMLTERATAAGFQVIDLDHAVNGADGTQSTYPAFSDDGAHPTRQATTWSPRSWRKWTAAYRQVGA